MPRWALPVIGGDPFGGHTLEATVSGIRSARLSAGWATLLAGTILLISSSGAAGSSAAVVFTGPGTALAVPATPEAIPPAAMSTPLLDSVSLTTPAPSSSSAVPASEPNPAGALTSVPNLISKPSAFVALGDSMTSGYGNRGPAWPVALAGLRPDLRLAHNSGVVGFSSADMLASLNREVYRYHPQVLIVLGGINDLYRGRSVASVLSNLEAIARNGRAHGLTVVLLTLPHDLIRNIQSKIDTLDRALIAYGLANGVQVIDLRTVIKTRGYTVNNGVHFNAAGVRAVSREIAAQLKV